MKRTKAKEWAPLIVAYNNVTLPIQVVSEANRREHWSKRHARKTEHWAGLTAAFASVRRPSLPATVRMVRLYRLRDKPMDSDNLARAFKGVRDWLAKWLGVDDGDPSVKWECDQDLDTVVGVRVEIRET